MVNYQFIWHACILCVDISMVSWMLCYQLANVNPVAYCNIYKRSTLLRDAGFELELHNCAEYWYDGFQRTSL